MSFRNELENKALAKEDVYYPLLGQIKGVRKNIFGQVMNVTFRARDYLVARKSFGRQLVGSNGLSYTFESEQFWQNCVDDCLWRMVDGKVVPNEPREKPVYITLPSAVNRFRSKSLPTLKPKLVLSEDMATFVLSF